MFSHSLFKKNKVSCQRARVLTRPGYAAILFLHLPTLLGSWPGGRMHRNTQCIAIRIRILTGQPCGIQLLLYWADLPSRASLITPLLYFMACTVLPTLDCEFLKSKDTAYFLLYFQNIITMLETTTTLITYLLTGTGFWPLTSRFSAGRVKWYV